VRTVPPYDGYGAGLIPSVAASWGIQEITANPASISRPAEMRLSNRRVCVCVFFYWYSIQDTDRFIWNDMCEGRAMHVHGMTSH
jgi:hypothetical protein